MRRSKWIRRVRCSLLAATLACYPGFAQSGGKSSPTEHWVPTWVTAVQSGRPEPIRIPQAPAAAQSRPSIAFQHQTIRMVVHTTIGGDRARVQLSNIYGAAPLRIGGAHIALRRKDSEIVPGSDHNLTFSGRTSFTIPIGAAMVSDPVDMDVPAAGDLLISVYVPDDTGPVTLHSAGMHTTYVSKAGDVSSAAAIADATTTQSFYWLSSVLVRAPADAAAVVAFGDSITDGTASTPNTDSSWPAFLARRLSSNPATSRVAVLNEGIAGNRILRDAIGPGGLARFERDVIAQPGVKWVTILEGINDIGAGIGEAFIFGSRANGPGSDNPTADDLIGGYRQMIDEAHRHGIKVIGCTLLPFQGAAYYSEGGNQVRKAANEWIRTSGAFDAVADFDSRVRDPKNLDVIRSEFDSGDHLHPSDAGYKAMAETIDLSWFK